MEDMLVRLYNLPDIQEIEQALFTEGILFRHPIAPEKEIVADWARMHFSDFWANEVEVAFLRQPVSCIIAQKENQLLGFSCYETTARAFFGPTGVLEKFRGKSIGKVLLVKALQSLRNMGYAYGIIGGVGPKEYYQKTVGAISIPGSEDSIYNHLLRVSNAPNK